MAQLHLTPKINERDNYYWLLGSILVLFFFSALFEQLAIEDLRRLSGLLLTVVILVSVWSVEHNRRRIKSSSLTTAVLIVVLAAEYFFEHEKLALTQLVSLLIFTVMSIVISCRQVLFSGHVDANNIVGAICIYLMFGIAFALAYLLVESAFPGSLPGLEGDDWRVNLQKSAYFSFVSLTTVGYGDISPVQPLARYLCYLQAVIGQFYIAILVASLVGVRMSNRQDS